MPHHLVYNVVQVLTLPNLSEQEIDGVTLLVDGAVKIFPVAPYLYVGFIKSPARANSLFIFPKGFFDTRRVVHDPALNGAMINGVASLLHQLFQVAIAQSISDIPADTLQDDFLLMMASSKAAQNLSNC